MPSGVTSPIYDGEEITRDEFLMRVARLYGLTIMQREESLDNPPRLVESNTAYHDDAIKKAEESLAEIATLTIEQASKKADEEYKDSVKSWEDDTDRRLAMLGRYETMIAEVESWEPEPAISYIKDGALEQLRESVKFDCGDIDNVMKYRQYPKRQGGPEWIQERKARAERDIGYHTKQIKEEEERTEERNTAIRALYRSLNMEVPA